MLKNIDAYLLISLTKLATSTEDTKLPNLNKIKTLLHIVDTLLFDDDCCVFVLIDLDAFIKLHSLCN